MNRTVRSWEAIEREYRTGQLSLREIGRQHAVTDTAIRKHAKQHGWQRDLSDRVRREVRNEIVRSAVREKLSREPLSDEEIVSVGRDRGAKAVQGHLSRAGRLKRLVDKKLDLLDAHYGDDSEARAQAAALLFPTKGDSLTAAERTVADMIERIAKLERQALNIDDAPASDAEVMSTAERIQAAVREMRRRTMGEYEIPMENS